MYNLDVHPDVHARRYARWLWALLAVFLVRIVAQPLALVGTVPILPPFDAWYSGVVPYGWLVSSQIVMAAALIVVVRRVADGRTEPRRSIGLAAIGVGAVYGGVMVVRLILGLTILREHGWFGRPLPTVVHIALAAFLIVYGRYHLEGRARG
jgi:hypothetical protein